MSFQIIRLQSDIIRANQNKLLGGYSTVLTYQVTVGANSVPVNQNFQVGLNEIWLLTGVSFGSVGENLFQLQILADNKALVPQDQSLPVPLTNSIMTALSKLDVPLQISKNINITLVNNASQSSQYIDMTLKIVKYDAGAIYNLLNEAGKEVLK